ncbi:FAD/NAD(P)-binding protein [Kitasatospora viridis]|uniref:FAD-NAD(P)-binding protein n=1 Tax=Kitasatospora viridis TaxID=281105 RepID=A0A561T7B8_9ACTN|nr:FAD/NAD(P)-binding protein [Kitasatospora viridis]TWF83004.1 FAD-NAD(P)-binding protein [Kitasatospora viridis]
MEASTLRVCIVGAGPRGLSVLERLCANERKSAAHPAVVVHVVDPSAPGPGRVWRVAQSTQLLMNTVASQITVYTDHSVEMEGPVESGPSLYEWAVATRAAAPAGAGRDESLRAELAALGPDSYPTRSLYGRYLSDAFREIVAGAPEHISVRVHRSRAVTVDTVDGAQVVTLQDGTRLDALDAVVLAQGHVPAVPVRAERELERTAQHLGLLYVPPANPADVDLAVIAPGQSVLLRGLGLNFFDYMALLTTGRGGRFEQSGDGLVYHPSGREPRLFAGSRRGVPYHARGENEKGAYGRHEPGLLIPEVVAELRQRAASGDPLIFSADLWPLIAREVQGVYYGALLAARGETEEAKHFAPRYLTVQAGQEEEALLADFGITPADHWDWTRIAYPYQDRTFTDRRDFHDWLLPYMEQDVREARAGNVSGPLKAALDVLRDLRNEIRLVVDHGGLEGRSHREELEGWYTPLNAFLSIGPPASRIEEMAALIRAGLLEVVGPGMRLVVDQDRAAFTAHSDRVGGAPVSASVLIEARLPEPDLRRTADPLLAYLKATGQCSTYRIPGNDGRSYETGGLAVTERPYRVIDAQGMAHPRRFAFGIPTESVHWVTAAGIRPGVNSVTLADSDAIARTLLALTPVPGRPTDRPVALVELRG